MPELSPILATPGERLPLLAAMLGFIVLELLAARLYGRTIHHWPETAATVAIAAVRQVIRVVEAAVLAMLFLTVHSWRLFDIPPAAPLALLGLYLAVEFCYYWQHRAAHQVRWMWATHAVHHSTTRLNLTAATRLGWTGLLSGNPLAYLPLAWIGFHPVAIAGMLGAVLLYQFLLHSELWPRLGPLELVLNTPTHHRVHHAANEACLDRNFGASLIVFDRLFGTFAAPPQDEPLRYGIAGAVPSHNPLRIALGEWLALARDARAARGLRARLKVLFGAPSAPSASSSNL